MTVLRLAGFGGANRAIHPKLLPDTVGVASSNQKPGRGDLRPWKNPLTVATVPAGRQTIYRMGRDVVSDSTYWLSWTGVVHAVRGFDAEDTTERTFYTGDGAPKVTDNTIGLASTPYPTASRPMALPAPSTAPVTEVTSVAGTDDVNVRVVVLAKVESNVATLTTAEQHGFNIGDTVNVNTSTGPNGSFAITDTPTASSFSYNATAADRATGVSVGIASVTKTAEAAETESYYYVYTYVNDWGWESAPSPVSALVERPADGATELSGFAVPPSGNYNVNRIRIYRTQAGTSGTADFYFLREDAYPATTLVDDNRELGEVCPTKNWLTPPDDLSNLTPMWNGMLAGISGNSVRMCEAYVPYAWPIEYDVVPPDSKPVALGVFGQTLLVLTTGRPLLVAGSSPDSLDQQPLEFSQGCASARSVVGMGAGVAWASEDGLCWYGAGGAKVLTAGLMTRDDWQAINPETVIGKMYEGLYFGSYDDGSGRKGFFIDPANPTGIYFTDVGYEALHFDELQDQLYVLSGGNVQRWDATGTMTVSFKSKVFRQPKPITMACAEVVADAYPVTFKVYADGALKHTQTVTGRDPFRLPSGFRAMDWQFEISGQQPVQAAVVASSMEELSQV